MFYFYILQQLLPFTFSGNCFLIFCPLTSLLLFCATLPMSPILSIHIFSIYPLYPLRCLIMCLLSRTDSLFNFTYISIIQSTNEVCSKKKIQAELWTFVIVALWFELRGFYLILQSCNIYWYWFPRTLCFWEEFMLFSQHITLRYVIIFEQGYEFWIRFRRW